MIKVAFLTNDLRNIDAHFGSAEYAAIYSLDANEVKLLKVVNNGGERTEGRVEMLKNAEVDILYCIEIGPAAAAKVVNSRIFPIKYKQTVSIESELIKLQSMLVSNPPPFIKKMQAQRA
ncbi:MAG: dinitrogenase iron-molybdenum cofactor biosynthesis protein [Campylobacteraceae bacterium]|jgi:nitrogen fixation protein NifX|nr:dinitrogenase iron-molybdenum cofactor biosynthesis protein [Campylobacteraceae bacterium]